MFGLLLLFVVGLVLSCSSPSQKDTRNLLSGRSPSNVTDVTSPERLTDGTISEPGDNWESNLTSIFKNPSSSVTWDLGRPMPVKAAFLQGDNNDEFFLLGSDDGKVFHEIWAAHSVRGAGMRARGAKDLDSTARYLKVTARGGDPAVSLSEVAVFEAVPPAWPPAFRVNAGKRPSLPGEVEALVFGVVASLALLFHRASHPSWLRWAAILGPVVTGYQVWTSVSSGWPPQQPVIDALRAISAIVAAAAVLRLALNPFDVMPRFVTGSLAAMAILSMTTFYNMWQPQFDYVEEGRMTWVHTWDMRVYFPTAKYFDELGFEGLYLASVAAYLEDAPGANERAIRNVELRDLRTYDMTTVANVSDAIHHVKEHFSPERWKEFKRDMSWFWKSMGPGGYLGSLRDHGGNATPAWLLVAWMMFRHTVASEGSLMVAAYLDPLLLLGFFAAAWRVFGLRTALVCIVVYGASTFPWFGSNWAGSTLRNDWMVFVGLGACALRKDRPALGGALLALGAMIRAFPAVAVFFLIAPLLVRLADWSKADFRMDRVRALLREERALVRAITGAAVCVGVLVVLSSLRFGFGHSWGVWAHKISMHSVSPNINHVGLRTLFQYDPSKTLRALAQTGGDWSLEQVHTFRARRPLYIVMVGAFTLLALAAARGRDLRQAALIGMMMIPIYFYPSNYYLHYVFVLPLLVDYPEPTVEYAEDEPRSVRRQRWLWGLVSFVMLLVCASEYWGFDAKGVDERYVQWSVGALVGYLVIFAALVYDGRKTTVAGS